MRPERIEPGKPQQGGRHERLHLTLEAGYRELPPAPEPAVRSSAPVRPVSAQIYNDVRPHEALDQQTPASVYRDAPRTYSGRLRGPDYPDDSQVRRVRTNGTIKWKGRRVFLSEVLKGEPVGLQEHEDGRWAVCTSGRSELEPPRAHRKAQETGTVDMKPEIPIGCFHIHRPNQNNTGGEENEQRKTVTHVPGPNCHPCPRLHTKPLALRLGRGGLG